MAAQLAVVDEQALILFTDCGDECGIRAKAQVLGTEASVKSCQCGRLDGNLLA